MNDTLQCRIHHPNQDIYNIIIILNICILTNETLMYLLEYKKSKSLQIHMK